MLDGAKSNLKIIDFESALVIPVGEDEVSGTLARQQPIITRYLDHVIGYRPIRDQYILIRSVPNGQ